MKTIQELKAERLALQKTEEKIQLQIEAVDWQIRSLIKTEENLENRCFVLSPPVGSIVYSRFLFKTETQYKTINYYFDLLEGGLYSLDFISFGLDDEEFLEQNNLKEITLKEFADFVSLHNQELVKTTQSI